MEQLRYNTGKPKLSYLFAHERALNEILYPLCDTDNYYQVVQNYLVAYLSGGSRDNLRRAVGAARFALEVELGGEPIERVEGQPLCDLADAAFCAVCVYGESKYERGNFRKGAPLTQYIDCALRHLRKIFRHQATTITASVSRDAESGEAHGAHVYWNLLEALEQPAFRDDRLPPVYGGEYDNGISSYLLPVPGEETPNHDYEGCDQEPAWDYDEYYACYQPDCGCGMCQELRPEMVEVEVVLGYDETWNDSLGASL